MVYTLGIDIGSSSVKVALLEVASGACAGSVTLPQAEMPIDAPHRGWAEQDPRMWWQYACEGIRQLMKGKPAGSVRAIGITYQMHGLVCLDTQGEPLRKSENEPDVFARTDRFMLPGDYILFKLSGERSTTCSGLSEQILWDFVADGRADFVADYYGIDPRSIPEALPSIGIQAHVSAGAAAELGLEPGIPIAYRAGDQPNNAFSLNVMEPGEIAATGGTSGVVYGVTDLPKADSLSRVNTFLHVNHSAQAHRYGVLLCINGTGILNAWAKRTVAPELSYSEVNQLCETVPAGSDGVLMHPFGNGAERMLENRYTGASVLHVDLNRHNRAHLLRAAQEGIAFAFRYGVDIMRESGLRAGVIRAGHANLFLSPLFRSTLATLCDANIELYNTDGALGAARGAALGAGLYRNRNEAFASLRRIEEVHPDPAIRQVLEETYQIWKKELQLQLENQ